MDKFPEAFKRFEEKVNTDNIESWKQLKLAFGSWAGRRWAPTFRQLDALEKQARKLGIPTQGHCTRVEEVQRIFTQTAKETRVAIVQKREKRFSIDYLDFQQWLNKTTRTTAYQRRVINYIRTHPNANLSEARVTEQRGLKEKLVFLRKRRNRSNE